MADQPDSLGNRHCHHLDCIIFQERTGPTHPLVGDLKTTNGDVRFKIARSETIGNSLPIIIFDPVPGGFNGNVQYRRCRSSDSWQIASFSGQSEEFIFKRRGRADAVMGRGVRLPTLQERAGKYEFFIFVGDARTEPFSITGDKAILARYKAAVPTWAIVINPSVGKGIRPRFQRVARNNFI